MAANRRKTVTFQYEPPVTPVGWKGDELRYAIRVTQLFDDIYLKYGRLLQENRELRERLETLEATNGTV